MININRTRLIQWIESLVFDPFYSGTYRDYRWVVNNWRESWLYNNCSAYDLHIISLKSNTVMYLKTHHTMSKNYNDHIIKFTEQRIKDLLYNDVP